MAARKTLPDLLTARQVCDRLGISSSTFYGDAKRERRGLKSRLRASGLKIVKMPSTVPGKPPIIRYTAESLERLIQVSATKEALLC